MRLYSSSVCAAAVTILCVLLVLVFTLATSGPNKGGVLAAITPDGVIGEKAFLHLLHGYPNARAIDGSPAAYYFVRGSKSKLIIFNQGGGLCASLESCFARSKTALGSSKHLPKEMPARKLNGFLSRDCKVSPTFCDFSIVYVPYLSGDLYSGNAVRSYVPPNASADVSLHFKGVAIREAVRDSVVKSFFGGANGTLREFIYSGGSAGGYQSFLFGAETVHFMRKNTPVRRSGVVPLSGGFPLHANADGVNVIRTVGHAMIVLANSTPTFNPQCVRDHVGDADRCFHPWVAFNYSSFDVPFFMFQSFSDAWQVSCELLAVAAPPPRLFQCGALPGFAGTACPAADRHQKESAFDQCTRKQAETLLGYQHVVLDRTNSTPWKTAPRRGYFLHSCFSHCAAQFTSYYTGTRVGGVPMAVAASSWWLSIGDDPHDENDYNGKPLRDQVLSSSVKVVFNESNFHVDCLRTMQMAGAGYRCNPTCAPPPSARMSGGVDGEDVDETWD